MAKKCHELEKSNTKEQKLFLEKKKKVEEALKAGRIKTKTAEGLIKKYEAEKKQMALFGLNKQKQKA